MIELELFVDVHPVPGGVDPNPNAERQRICRVCASEVLLYNLRDWWVRERKKGFLEEHVSRRPDCPDGAGCGRQKDGGERSSCSAVWSVLGWLLTNWIFYSAHARECEYTDGSIEALSLTRISYSQSHHQYTFRSDDWNI